MLKKFNICGNIFSELPSSTVVVTWKTKPAFVVLFSLFSLLSLSFSAIPANKIIFFFNKFQHKESTSQCGICGESFALAQELSVHVRSKCRINVGGKRLIENDVSIKKCLSFGCSFSCSSHAMMLLHLSLKVTFVIIALVVHYYLHELLEL